MEVSDVLRERMQEPGGLTATAAVSLFAHAALLGALIAGPLRMASHSLDENKPVITISLGGSTGPDNGGMTNIGARAVQTTEPAPKPEALRAPAAKTPEMTVPLPKATPVKAAKAPSKELENIAKIPDARGRTLARGDEINNSPAVAVTGARGQGFGLSTGGGNGLGAKLDVGDFCCPDYIVLMNQKIDANWQRKQEVGGQVTVKFTILRDGRLIDTAVERSSGVASLDNAARRAVELTRQLTTLPAAYTNPSLTIHLTFEFPQ